MIDVAERLINLAMHLAAARSTVTAEAIRATVAGYPDDQDEAAFKRMLERDKEFLRTSGFAITCDDEGNYQLDRSSTYAAHVTLDAAETAALRTAGSALAADTSFPFADALRLALAKLSADVDHLPVAATAALADEDAERQGGMVAALSEAAQACKRVALTYTNFLGDAGTRDVDPYGLFLHAGRWYLVAQDVAKDEIRTFAVSRMSAVTVNPARPKQHDFERPEDFAVERFIRLPFQYGPDSAEFAAEIRFDAERAWRAEQLASRCGTLETLPDGSVLWRAAARSAGALARFVVENGPGLTLVAPEEAVRILQYGLSEAEALHG